MPRLNAAGQATPRLGAYWYDDARLIYQDCSTGVCRIVLSDGTVIAQTGTNTLTANGHRVWAYVDAATLDPANPTTAVYHDAFGRVRTNCFPHTIAPDGAIAVKPHSNLGVTVLEPDGREWPLSGADAQGIQGLGADRWLWTINGIVHAAFPLIGDPGVPVWWPRAAEDGTLLYQSRDDGALVLGGHVIAPPSDKYFYPDVRLIGGVYVVCWSPSQADTDARFIRLTPAQLASMPKVGTNVPDPGIPPIPPKREPPVSVPNQLSVVQSVRAKYPTPLGAQHPAFLIEVARATGAKLLRKDAGSHVTLPDGRNVSQDILVFANGQECFDILSDAEGAATPSWQEKGAIAGEYYDVGSVSVPDEPPPSVPAPDLSAVNARLLALESTVAKLVAWTRGV